MPLRFLFYQIRMQTIHHKVINWIWLHEKLGFPYSLKNCLENGKIVLKTSFNFENLFYNLEIYKIWENFSLNNRYENHKIRYIKWNYDKLTCNNFFRYSMYDQRTFDWKINYSFWMNINNILRETLEWTRKISNKFIQFVQMCIEKNVNQKKVEDSFIVQVSLTYIRRL